MSARTRRPPTSVIRSVVRPVVGRRICRSTPVVNGAGGVVERLLNYGALGILCVILLLGCIHLYRAKDRQQKEATQRYDDMVKSFQDEIRGLHELARAVAEKHKEDMRTLSERHVAKAETWIDKGNEYARDIHAVLDRVTRRDRDRS